MAVRRIVAYAGGDEVAASRDFYVEVLGMRVAMEDPVLDLQSPDDPAPEVIIGARGDAGPAAELRRRRR
jgi:catechol 2,3-dioxygenase-like lactoylglutathione lyase family enzyme